MERSAPERPRTREDCAALAEKANRVGRASRREAAPVLTADIGAETIAQWLQWCDPNGCHTAAQGLLDGFEPHTVETAWEALAEMLSGE